MRYRITLDKEYFHFCSAHFVIFDATEKEGLHGHNYYVALTVEGEELHDGKLINIDALKVYLKALCDDLDHHLLLPGENPHLRIERGEQEVVAHYGALRYSVPQQEVHVLPLDNITMENLARYVAQAVHQRFRDALPGLDRLEVTVRETRGQAASATLDWTDR